MPLKSQTTTTTESQRLARLRELLVLDSEPEPVFDSIARLASEICGRPIALLSLVDEQRQWFKANVGLPGVNETPRDVAFCAHAIADDALFEVPDATLDVRFAANPLVAGAPDIRFYAGAPLVLPGGERVGTLCVIDRHAGRLEPHQAAMLHSLAAIATQALVMRRELIDKSLSVRTHYEQALAVSQERYRAIVEMQTELVSLASADGVLLYVNPAYARHFGRAPEAMQGGNLFDFIEPGDREAVRLRLAGVLETGHQVSSENRMLAPDGQERWVAWSNMQYVDPGGEVLLHSVGLDVTERKRAEQALRASQAFLARTGRAAGVGGWELDLRTRHIVWSDEIRRIHEVPPDYVPRFDEALSFYAVEARASILGVIDAAIADGTPWDLELPLVTAAGRRIWVRTVGEAEFEDGRAARLVGAFQDITERKQLEQRLADNERFVRQVTDSLPIRIAYVDRELRYRFVNQAHCQRFGLEREAILGRRRDELTGRPTDPAILASLAAALQGRPQRFEFEEPASGPSHPPPRRIESQLIPDLADSGEVRGIFTTGIDITARSASEQALRELTAIFDNTTDFVVQSDWRGDLVYMNPAARLVCGIAPDAPVAGRSFREFHTPETNQLYLDVIVPAVKQGGVWVGESAIYDARRQVLPVSHLVIAHRDASGRVERYSSMMRDISAEIEAKQQALRQSATLRSVAEAIPAMVAVVGAADDRYRFVNTAFERGLGMGRDQIIGRTTTQVLGAAEARRSRPWVERVLAGETVSFEKDAVGPAADRHLAISYLPLWLDDGRVDGFVEVAQDITQHKQEAVRLVELAQRDALTGALNRAGFEAALERRVRDGGALLALLYIDLDHFKPVNDRHGHPAGDQVLALFAQRLRTLVRPTDDVARVGGDEFAVVLSGLREQANAFSVADKIVAAATQPFEVGALSLTIGASVGIAFSEGPATDWRDLIARADAMLYRAKAAGRGRHEGLAG